MACRWHVEVDLYTDEGPGRTTRYRLTVRGFLLVAVTTCVSIGVGVAVESTQIQRVPSTVEAAIEKTLAVKSIEIRIFVSSGPADIGPVIYQAPDRSAFPASKTGPGSPSVREVIIGNREYFEPTGGGRGTGILGVLNQHPPPSVRGEYGLTPAALFAFEPLVFVRGASDFRKRPGGYAFRLSIGHPVGPTTSRGTGGFISISHGYVRDVTIDEILAGRAAKYSCTYSHINTAPPVAAPPGSGRGG